MTKFFYEKNTYLLDHPTNVKFEEILRMDTKKFRQWAILLRKAVVYAWDELGVPPVIGKSEADMIDGMNRIIGVRVNEFLVKDDDGNENVIKNSKTELSGILGGFFPTIMKVKINYTKDSSKGRSIYDFFAQPELLDTFITYATRHFKRDSFYAYSTPVKSFDRENAENFPCEKSAIAWIEKFEKSFRGREDRDYWLAPIDEDKTYTGYKEELKTRVNLSLNRKELEKIWDSIPEGSKTNVDWARSETYQLRSYYYGQRLFPVGFKAFRVSFCQVPAQFPPLTARYLYERFTESLPRDNPIIVYDPSAGWGGRLLGAMAVDDRPIHYIGTDPNLDHNTTPGRTKYHELADFFNENTNKAAAIFPNVNTYEIFQEGSEVIHKNKAFQKWRGKVDMIFTSPPYFSREKYSESEGQSFGKFAEYADWRDGFLAPTLKTAWEWLKSERWCLWNISDLAVGGNEFLSLEQDSLDIAKRLGFIHKETLKMTLAQMPGSGRVDENGLPKAKNSIKVGGKWLRFEPIFCFWKP